MVGEQPLSWPFLPLPTTPLCLNCVSLRHLRHLFSSSRGTPERRPEAIWMVSACATAVVDAWIPPMGTCHAKMPFKKFTLSQERAMSHFTTDRKCFLLFHWAWQKGLVDTVKEFKYSALTVALYLLFSRYQKKKKKIGMVPLLLHLPRDRKLWIAYYYKKMYWFWNQIALFKTWVVCPADSLQIQILLLKPWWLKQLGNYKQVAKCVPHLLIFKFKVRHSTLSQLLFFSGQAGCEWLRSNLSQTFSDTLFSTSHRMEMQKSRSWPKQRLWFKENVIFFVLHMFHGLSLVNGEGESRCKLQSSFQLQQSS